MPTMQRAGVVLLLVGCVVLAQAAHAAAGGVTVTNTPSNPVPVAVQGTAQVTVQGIATVKSSDAPGRQPFQKALRVIIQDGDSTAAGTVTVPAGKRLVIEHVTVQAIAAPGTALFNLMVKGTVQGEEGRQFLPIEHTSNVGPNGGTDFIVAGGPVRLYADPGTFVSFSAQRFPVAGILILDWSVSGYLIDL
jgi:hypothetical protein